MHSQFIPLLHPLFSSLPLTARFNEARGGAAPGPPVHSTAPLLHALPRRHVHILSATLLRPSCCCNSMPAL